MVIGIESIAVNMGDNPLLDFSESAAGTAVDHQGSAFNILFMNNLSVMVWVIIGTYKVEMRPIKRMNPDIRMVPDIIYIDKGDILIA